MFTSLVLAVSVTAGAPLYMPVRSYAPMGAIVQGSPQVVRKVIGTLKGPKVVYEQVPASASSAPTFQTAPSYAPSVSMFQAAPSFAPAYSSGYAPSFAPAQSYAAPARSAAACPT